MSTLIDLADAIVTSLNAGEFSREFEAARHYQPVYELADLQTLRVSVVPKSVEIAAASRSESYFDAAIDVAVQQRVDPGDSAALDALMQLVEEIGDFLRRRWTDTAAFIGLENEPVFDPEHLNSEHVFTSLLTVRYRVRR